MCWFTVKKFISIAFKLRLQEPLTDCFFFYLTLIEKTKVMNGGGFANRSRIPEARND